eukprot:5091822-Pyramimonas_sp.AAC.1
MSAHPSHVSWPPRSSAEGPSGAVRMRPRHPFRHTPRTLRGPTGAPPKVPMARFACAPAIPFGTPLTRFVAP